MAWICEQEGIEADPEALAVLAAGRRRQRARFALRARSGDRLLRRQTRMPPKCARCSARSRWNRWRRSRRRWPPAIRARMLEVVDELERNGQNLQHFSRELSRYFRNLLVARIAGRGYAPGGRQRRAARETGADRRRFLRRGPDPLPAALARSLPAICKPRCSPASTWRSAWCGWCRPAACCPSNRRWRDWARRRACAAAAPGLPPAAAAPAAAAARRRRPPRTGPRRSNWIAPRRPARARPSRNPPAPTRSRREPKRRPMTAGDPRERLHAWLTEIGMPSPGRRRRERRASSRPAANCNSSRRNPTRSYFKDRDFEEAVREVFGRPLRIKVTVGEAGARPAPIACAAPPSADAEDDATGRALANPEVQRFREVFGGEVRKVRNLKE